MEKFEKITLLANIVFVGFVFAVIFHYILGFYMHLPYPFNTFTSPSNMSFSDFTNIMDLIKDFMPYKNVSIYIVYFPLTYIFLFPFTFIQNKIIAYLSFLSIFLSFLIISPTVNCL